MTERKTTDSGKLHYWSLYFRHRGAAAGKTSRTEILRAFGDPPVIEREWIGNPRDYYSRQIDLEMKLSEGVFLSGCLGVENAMTPGPADPQADHFERPFFRLSGSDAQLLDKTWQDLASKLSAIGYEDETLVSMPREMIIHLREQSQLERVATLRRQITEALVHKLSTQKPGQPVSICYTDPDDWDKVLSAIPFPDSVEEIWLDGCVLEPPPAALARFTRLKKVSSTQK